MFVPTRVSVHASSIQAATILPIVQFAGLAAYCVADLDATLLFKPAPA